MDNYFTDMVLATTLLQNELTLVGTVRKNKTFIPPSCLPSRSREEKSSIFAFQQKIHSCVICAKNNKAVLLLSTMHNSISVTDDDEKKPEINIFYNETKGGMNCLDMLVHNYMSKRQTRRWPMSFFHNLVDVVGVAAFIVWTCQHPEWNACKTNKRKLFLKDLGEKLVDAEISGRIQKGYLRKKSRAVIEQMGYFI